MTLTPQIIQQLFKEEPHIHLAYQENVPGKLDAAAFWQKYGEFLVRRVSILRSAAEDGGSIFAEQFRMVCHAVAGQLTKTKAAGRCI